MALSPIEIFNQTDIKLPFSEEEAFLLAEHLCKKESVSFEFVEIVFIDEAEIININKEFLSRNYLTDIISFRYDEDQTNQAIEGTLYCCAPRIREQAKEFKQTEKKEFLRIIIHGLLHLCGYEDDSEDKKKEMTLLEDYFLAPLLY